MIKKIFSSLNESEWRDIFSLVKDSYNIDLKCFDTGVHTAQPHNPKMSLTYLSPLIIEKIYMDLDLKLLTRNIKNISHEQPSFSMNTNIEEQ